MTTKSGVAVTASGNDKTLPLHLLFPEPQLDLLFSSTKEPLVHFAGLEESSRSQTVDA